MMPFRSMLLSVSFSVALAVGACAQSPPPSSDDRGEVVEEGELQPAPGAPVLRGGHLYFQRNADGSSSSSSSSGSPEGMSTYGVVIDPQSNTYRVLSPEELREQDERKQ